jgi:hypothetical protein
MSAIDGQGKAWFVLASKIDPQIVGVEDLEFAD